MHNTKALWFDLDDTLFDHTYSVCCGLDAIREKYPAFGDGPTSELAALYNRALNHVYADYLRGEISFREMRKRKLQFFYSTSQAEDCDLPSLDEFHDIYDAAYRVHRRATPGSVEVVKRFADRGISLAVLTNGDREIQAEKLQIIGLKWMIPNLLTPRQAGAPKPDPQIYKWALEQTSQEPENVVMVGDSLENDVEAALRCGLSAVLYAPGSRQQIVSTTYGVAPVIREWSCLPGLIGDTLALGATR